MAGNVSRPREVVKPAKRVFSAKIEFNREHRLEATQNQQFLVTAVGRWRISESSKSFQNQANKRIGFAQNNFGISPN
jgi:hypothetical protein